MCSLAWDTTGEKETSLPVWKHENTGAGFDCKVVIIKPWRIRMICEMSIQRSCVIRNASMLECMPLHKQLHPERTAHKTYWLCNVCCSTFHMWWSVICRPPAACPISATDICADRHSWALRPAFGFSSLHPSSSGNFPALSSLPFYCEILFHLMWFNFFLQVQRELNESLIQSSPSLTRCMKDHLLCKLFKRSVCQALHLKSP